MNTRIAIAALAAVLMAGGLAFAQPASSSSSSTPAAATTTAADSTGALSCRTHHAAGEACACKKAPSRRGTAQAGATGGHAMCMAPARHS